MTTLQSTHFITSLPRLLRNPKQILSDKKLLSETVPLLSFLEPIGPLIFSPIIVDLESRKKKVKPEDRKDQDFQEFLDQAVTTVIHFASFLLGGYLAKRALPVLKPKTFKPGSVTLENAQTVVSISASIFGNTFIRPFVDTKVVFDKAQDDEAKKPHAVWAVPQSGTSAPAFSVNANANASSR